MYLRVGLVVLDRIGHKRRVISFFLYSRFYCVPGTEDPTVNTTCRNEYFNVLPIQYETCNINHVCLNFSYSLIAGK